MAGNNVTLNGNQYKWMPENQQDWQEHRNTPNLQQLGNLARDTGREIGSAWQAGANQLHSRGIIPTIGDTARAYGNAYQAASQREQQSSDARNQYLGGWLMGAGNSQQAQPPQQRPATQQNQNVAQQAGQSQKYDIGQLPYYQGRGQTGLMGEQQFQYGTGNDIAANQYGMDKMQGTSTDVYKAKLANGQAYYTNVPEQGLPRAGAGTVSSGNMQAMDNMIARQNGLMQPQQMQQQAYQGYQFAPVRSNVLPDYQANQQMQRDIRDLTSQVTDMNPYNGGERYKAKVARDMLDKMYDFDVKGNQATQMGMQKMGMDESQFGSTMRNRQNEFGQTNALEQQRQGLMDRKNMMDYQQALAELGVQGMREQRAMEAQRQKGLTGSQQPTLKELSRDEAGNITYGALTDKGFREVPNVDKKLVEWQSQAERLNQAMTDPTLSPEKQNQARKEMMLLQEKMKQYQQ